MFSVPMFLKRKDIIFVLSWIIVLCIITGGLWTLDERLSVIMAILMSLAAILVTILLTFRKTQAYLADMDRKRVEDYKQTEAMFSLFAYIRPHVALPPMRGWSISPDTANIIMSLISENRPDFILEAGSGVSTVIAAYCLEKLDQGKIISLEHERDFAERTRRLIRQHRLGSYASVVYAPLVQVKTDGINQPWYDISKIELNEGQIDLLIVDGPPRATHSLARYPALTVLYKYMSEKAVIILDDYNRADERQAGKLWLEKFPQFVQENINTEHGTLVLSVAGVHRSK